MTEPCVAASAEPNEAAFFKALMSHIMAGSMIPKVQVERSVGPIIGFFLAEALSARFSRNIVMLCPEFPIRKARSNDSANNQSTNIDWLMFNQDDQELVLVELKTTDTSFRQGQSDIYTELQKTIAQQKSAAFLIEELQAIAAASQETGKYENVMAVLAQKLDVSEADLPRRLADVGHAKIIYLAPEVSKPATWPENNDSLAWLSFGDLPADIEHSYAAHWPAVRSSVVMLDTLSRRMRNGEAERSLTGKNYRFLLTLDELLTRCRTDGASILIGLMDWRSTLPVMSAEQLREKTYKCDIATNGLGKKIPKNWIGGDQFLAQVIKVLS